MVHNHAFARRIVTFGRVLRKAGLNVGTGQIVDALRAVELLGVQNRDDLYQALFSIFVCHREQRELFDQAFYLFWKAPSRLPKMMEQVLPFTRVPESPEDRTSARVKSALEEESGSKTKRPPAPRAEDKKKLEIVFTYSDVEILRKKDFADFTAEEMLQAKELFQRMHWPIEPYASRRRTADWKGRLLDLRRTMRRSLRHHAEFVRLSWLGHHWKARPLIILCDISGSMERYSRMLLHFMHAITEHMQKIETFVFGTRLTRVTRYLQHRDIDRAITEVSEAVQDWAGGTKIGETLKAFNYQWARRVLRNGPVVLIISDGWDRGDSELLRREMARLSRSCHRLIWLNPLLGYEGYEPLTRGMQTALPYIDDFLPVHNLESLEQLGRLLGRISRRESAPRSAKSAAA